MSRPCTIVGRRVVWTETEHGVGALCPFDSMVRVSYDVIIGDAPVRGAPVGKIVRSVWHPPATRLLHNGRGHDGYAQHRICTEEEQRRHNQGVCPRSCRG